MIVEKKNLEENKNLKENKIKPINANYLKKNQKNTKKLQDEVTTVIINKTDLEKLKILANKFNIPINKLYAKLVDYWREYPYIGAFFFILGGLVGAIAAVAAIIASEELPEYPKNIIQKAPSEDFINNPYSDPSHDLNLKTSNSETLDPETSDFETKKINDINDNEKTSILPKNYDNRIIRRGWWDATAKTNLLNTENQPESFELRQGIQNPPASPDPTEGTLEVSAQSTPGSPGELSLSPELNEAENQTANRGNFREPSLDELDPDAMWDTLRR